MYQHKIVGVARASKPYGQRIASTWPQLFVSSGLAAFDLLVTFAAIAAGILAYNHAQPDVEFGLQPTVALAVGASFVVFLVLLMRHCYQGRNIVARRTQLLAFIQAWGLCILLALWAAFLTKTTAAFSRGAISIAFGPGMLCAFVLRTALVELIRRSIVRGQLRLTVGFLIHAGGDSARERLTERLLVSGVSVSGSQAIDIETPDPGDIDVEILDAAEKVRRLLASGACGAVFVAIPWSCHARLRRLRAALSRVPLPVYVLPDLATHTILSGHHMELAGTTAFEVQRPPLSKLEQGVKRSLDMLAAGLGLVLLSPVLLLVSAAILLSMGRPILFRQARLGFGGQRFAILKFRTMTVAENGLDVRQAVRNDPRVTPIGALLRSSSLDELPQLWNVLRGEMSLVGPRPHAIAHDNHYDQLISSYALRQNVKPGITGWAQVNGHRGETREVEDMEARVDHDLWYISNFSLWLDIRIIVSTVALAFFDKRAY